MTITFTREDNLSPDDFVSVLERSGLAVRRPAKNERRIAAMVRHANLIITARDSSENDLLVGVSRCLTDFSFCCYCSDLAVDADYQRQGIGEHLLLESRSAAGEEAFFLLLSAPDALGYYPAVGMKKLENAFCFPRDERFRTA